LTVSSPEPANVPVALFVHRRPEVLGRTLECLRVSGIAQLYVFSDGPRDDSQAGGVAKVREVVRALDWIQPVIVEQPENLGLSASIRAGLDMVFARHEAAVVIEDDIQVAPEFHAYACAALAHYAECVGVAGVTGLRLPFDASVFAEYPYDVFMCPRFSSWGWATWRDRWEGFSFDAASLRSQIEARGDVDLGRAGADMPSMVDQAVVKETLGGAWDAFCATNVLLRGQDFVTPAWNMVENTGVSGGSHQHGKQYRKLAWEPDRRPPPERIRFAPVEEDDRILDGFRSYFAPRGVRGALARLRARALQATP
jgi:hypothetical protein